MESVINKAIKYWMGAGRTGLAHYKAAEIAARRSKQIGIPNVALSAIVATSVFATLNDSSGTGNKLLLTGGIALLSAILAALQAF